jgi:peptidyl-prolyl cis-trans isomerase B (cyclophilin B)
MLTATAASAFGDGSCRPVKFRRASALSLTEDPVASSKNQEREAREARDRLKLYNARQAVHTHQGKRRRRDNLIAGAGVLLIAALATGTQLFYFSAGPGAPTPEPSASAPAAGANIGEVPAAEVSEFRTWTGELALNDVSLQIELDGASAPQGVAAFVTDVQSGYFLGKTCHRLVMDANTGLIQCGSEDGTGSSDSANYAYGPIENAPADGIYTEGLIAIARTGDNAFGNGHQFFIVFADSTLPGDSAGGYTVIGKVTSGLENLVSNIAAGGIVANDTGSTDGEPVVPTTITAATIQ